MALSLPIIVRRRRFAGSAWTPASLFTFGEQGAWYDPSDLTTLFQDAAGSTPVTAAEQPVGLILDKSKGGRQALGTTGWVKNSGDGVVTVVGNVITITGATTTTRVDLAAPGWAIGDYGDVTVTGDVSGATSPLVYVGLGNPYSSVSGTNTFRNIISSGVILRLQIGAGSATFTVTSCGRVPGNHATQSVSGSRPLLSARYNLLTQTENFADAAWSKTNIALTAGVSDPNGGTKATTVTAQANNVYIFQGAARSGAATTSYTASVYIRRRTGTGAIFLVAPDGSGSTNITSSVSSTWTRFAVTGLGNANGSTYAPQVTLAVSGDAVDIAFPDLRVANEPAALPAYQRVTTSTDYDTVNFPPYLRFDGSDDSLATASIDFSSTDKMTVFAGVRKLTSGTRGMLVELSATAANSGAFNVSAPEATDDYGFALTGNVGSPYYQPTGYAGPVTNVLSCVYDYAGAGIATEIFPRINAVSAQSGAVGTAAGTNTAFLNAPLFIGRRNNASIPFNGRLFSLIVRGAATSAADINNAENYVETKTFGKDMNIVYVDEVTIGPTNELVTIGPSAEQVYVYQQYV